MLNRDGKSHLHRRLTSAEDYAACFNGLVKSQMTPIKSLAQGLKGPVIQPIPKSKIEQASRSLNTVLLCEKLIALKEAQDKSEQVEKFNRSLNDKLNSAQPREFPPVEDSMYVDDQSILDQHVSRVFSPQFSPGTMSPRHLQRYQHRPNEMSTSMPDFGKQIANQIDSNRLIFMDFLFHSSPIYAPFKINSGACIVYIVQYHNEKIIT